MNDGMKVFGLAGWSGSGKTTLLSGLLPELCAQGVVVVTVKYMHHSFDIFTTDHIACEWRDAGASEVMYVSDQRWALIHELQNEVQPSIEELCKQFGPADLILIEGFKFHNHAKLEIFRSDISKPLLAKNDKWIVAIASDSGRPEQLPENSNVVILDLNDIPAVAEFIIGYNELIEDN